MNRTVICNTISMTTSHGVWNGDSPLHYSFPLLATQLFIVFVTTRTLYFILQPLKQPRVVSDVIAGILLGPSGLGGWEKFHRTIFPPRGEMVLDTVAMFGIMYVIFLIGVKMDPSVVIKSLGRREAAIGILGLSLPFIVVLCLSYILNQYLVKDIRNVFFFVFLAASLSVTSIAVLVPILSEFNLLNSELGRVALSSSMTNDVSGWFFISFFIIFRASLGSAVYSLWAFLSLASLVIFIVFIVRPMAKWVVQQTPPGKPVEEIYIFMILVGVAVVGLLSDVIGASSFNGALFLGLAIPDGPPLGAALVEKLEHFTSGLLLPLYFTMSGLKMNVFAIDDITSCGMLQFIIFMGCISKFIGVLLPSLYYKVPIRDAISLCLFMTSKGLVELVTYNSWMDSGVLDEQSLTVLVVSAVSVTAIVIPIVRILYDPSTRYIVYKRRTIQHSNPNEELRLLACVHTQSNVPTIINIVEASHATKKSPICIYILHLVQLVGRGAPLLISHNIKHTASSSFHSSQSEHITNAFQMYEGQNEAVKVHPFTSISPYTTMHDEICGLALTKRVSLVIIPFHKQPVLGGGTEANHAIRTMNNNVLANTPCSVGILVDCPLGGPRYTLTGQFTHKVLVLFFGGDDDREALSYADRMAKHPGINVTVMRLLPNECSTQCAMMEWQLDNELSDDFKQKNITNENVQFREEVVKDMEEILSVIRALNNNHYDLIMVGMRHDTFSSLNQGSTDWNEWSECPELGVIGDIVASIELGKTPILVIRQHLHVQLQLPDNF